MKVTRFQNKSSGKIQKSQNLFSMKCSLFLLSQNENEEDNEYCSTGIAKVLVF
jgi:hypothetical protein